MSSFQTITSLRNPSVILATQLHRKAERDALGQIWVEGRHPVDEALKAGLSLVQLFVLDSVESLPEAVPSEKITVVSEAVMHKISTTSSPLPMAGIFTIPMLPHFSLHAAKRLLGLVGLQDPGNVGTLIRAACAFGIDALLMMGQGVDPYHPKVIRATAGLVFRVPIFYFADWASLQTELPEGVTCWATDVRGGQAYHDVLVQSPWLLLMGEEAHGLPEEIFASSQRLHIPMVDGVESLNVAMAGGIILADWYCRQS